jgi:hypothetical protein
MRGDDDETTTGTAASGSNGEAVAPSPNRAFRGLTTARLACDPSHLAVPRLGCAGHGSQKIAVGLTGDPVPRTIRSGEATNRNSQRPIASQCRTTSSNWR